MSTAATYFGSSQLGARFVTSWTIHALPPDLERQRRSCSSALRIRAADACLRRKRRTVDMVVKAENFVTAGDALDHMDLALWLIRNVSPELASFTAEYLIVDSRPSQTPYTLTAP